MAQLEAMAAQDTENGAHGSGYGADGNMLQSQETIKTYIKNFTENDKLNFTQGLLNFANKIEKRWLVEGLVMSLHLLANESSKIKVALLD